MPPREHLHYQIANLHILLELHPTAAEPLIWNHGGFLTTAPSSDPDLHIVATASKTVTEVELLSPPQIKRADPVIRIRQPHLFDLLIDLRKRTGTVFYQQCPSDGCTGGPQGIRGLLKSLLAFLLPHRDGLLLHASAVKTAAGCAAFVGRSGAGKSTVASMFGKDAILNDDIVAITNIHQHPRVHATPLSGMLDGARLRCSGELRACFALEKGEPTKIKLLDSAQAFRILSDCIALPTADSETEKRAFELSGKLLMQVPWNLFCFRPRALEVQHTLRDFLQQRDADP